MIERSCDIRRKVFHVAMIIIMMPTTGTVALQIPRLDEATLELLSLCWSYLEPLIM
jgi:hypothetical protein